jgi:hypothetical protein
MTVAGHRRAFRLYVTFNRSIRVNVTFNRNGTEQRGVPRHG